MRFTLHEIRFTRYEVLLAFLLLTLSLPTFAQLPEGEGALPGEEGFEEPLPPPLEEPPPGVKTPETRTVAPEKPEGEAKGEDAKTKETPPEEELHYLNFQDQDIKEVIKAVAKFTGKNFILDAKVTGKVTILSHKMMTKEEIYQAFLSALQTAGFTTVAGPGGVLKIVPLRDAKGFPIPTHVDTTPLTDSFVTRLIKLENISATDMAEAIKPLISPGNTAYLFAYPETNTLVLTDSGTNIDRLMKIIKELDQEGPQEVVEIIQVHFASAKEIASIVLSLYEAQGGAARGGGARRPGGTPEETQQISKIIADERTNAIIVLASKRAMEKVKELINRLDAKLEEGQEGKIHVHYLKYAKAEDIATVLQNLAGAAKAPGAAGAQAGTIVAELEDFKVAPDKGTNSLLITSTAKTYRTLVEKVLSLIDIPRKQVYLEAMVIEFFLSNNKAFGISTHGGTGSDSVLGFGQTFSQLAGLFDAFNPANTASAFFNSPGLLGGILSRRTVDIKVTGTDGATKTVTVPAFSAFLTALSSMGDTNLVASPNLLALDNEDASIEIIRKEPEPGQTTISATGLQQLGKPERIEAGLRLKLTPTTTEQGTIRLKIDQQFSSFTAAKNTNLGTQAIVERKVTTSVITNDGQTVVIGGLMQDEVSIEKSKIPVLGDIPLLGYLFKKSRTGKSKSNLLLFITPHIIRDSSDFTKILKRKMGQQRSFMTKNYKKKQQGAIDTVLKEHNENILDVLEETGGGADSSLLPVQARQALAVPVITAPPGDEPKVTIVLPPPGATLTPVPLPPELAPAPVAAPPAPAPVLAPALPPPPEIIEIAPKKPRKEVQAAPVAPPPPLPAPESHSPVITLPPGASPDLLD